MDSKGRNDIFTTRIHLGTSECDYRGQWKIASILEAAQNTANEHSDALQIWHRDLESKGVSWVLSKTEISVERYPRLGETVFIKTFTKGVRALFSPRYFLIEDEAGDEVARIGSLMLLLDHSTRKAVAPDKVGIMVPDSPDLSPTIKIPMRKVKVEGKKKLRNHVPQYSDIDVNRHVNNTKYVEWLCNDLGFDVLNHQEIESATICYLVEILPEQTVTNALVINGDQFQYSGESNGTPCFEISGRLRNKVMV